ncbi:MIZ/SP-RING zinc finger family protein [Leishmania donovani]|uniref:MIZ/SP-RING zinc finger family protein n=2 Tax=Leishmania donovani TaxID=5661 RepID=A0A504XG77_LEIDO|nr:MIZ/SP-RING zinc finger family protein [Leishmania donovani]
MAHANDNSSLRGMTESDWRRLHSRIIPNRISLPEFKSIVSDGTVHDHYLAKDLHKIMQELRDLLYEHGELREASVLPLSGKKQELSRAAATAVRLIDCGGDAIPALRRPSDISSGAAGALGDLQFSTSPTLGSASDTRLSDGGKGSAADALSLQPPQATASTLSISPRRSSRVLPLTDHIQEEGQTLVSGHSLNMAPQPTVLPPSSTRASPASSPPSTHAREKAPPPGGSTCPAHASASTASAGFSTRFPASRTANARVSSTVAHNAATSYALVGAPSTSSASPAAPPSLLTVPLSTPASNEIAQLNESAPPFFRILSVPRRFQLRFGSSMLRFEIPVQYVDGVNSRQLRIYMIPLRHPNTPARWPTAKEIVVYVNKQCVMTPWKRSWPDREREVAETYLPLDITYLLSRNTDAQHVQVDIHNKEYQTPAILAVVQLRSLEEVTEWMLSSRLGCRNAVQARQMLLSRPSSANALASTSSASLLLSNNAVIQRTYAAIMADDEEDDGLEMDDPVITTKCPISQLPLSVPVRGSRCTHLQCVDLNAFLVSSNKASYWNCALCDAEMRPCDVRVDTILWSYLCTFASVAAYPLYLRLSARAAPKEGEPRYHWHPSTRTGEDADVVLDDSESDGENERTRDPPSVSGPAAASISASSMEATAPCSEATSVSAPNGARLPAPPAVSHRGEAWAEGLGHLRKRGRDDDASTEEPRGTADDPIEL